MRRARLLVIGIGALTLSGCPSATAPRQIGIGGGGGGSSLLAFVVQPTNATVGTIISPAVEVAVTDTLGLADSTATGGVSLFLTTPGGATLSGTNSQPLVGGIATFPDLAVDLVGTYTLTATSSGRTNAVSKSFAIFAAP